MIKKISSYLKRNFSGYHTDRKIVLFESDDWGSIKMPTKEIYEYLKKKNYNVDKDPYSRYDSIETSEDLELLFGVLKKFKDKNGHPAKFTANAVVANPDFDKIRGSNYNSYHYEPLASSFAKKPGAEKSLELWQEGFDQQLFVLQYHGREHLNVDRWMLDLKDNELPQIREAFELNMTPFAFMPSYMSYGYMEGLDFFTEEEKLSKDFMIRDGYKLFKELVGTDSKSFIANCYIWHPDIENTLKDLGINYLQSNPNQIVPFNENGIHTHQYKPHYTGEKNKKEQIYLVRNVHFEPSLNPSSQTVESVMRQIANAFLFKKPAIISSHRLNYIGSIDANNRDKNLRLLAELLKQITKRWPEVEFMSSNELGDLIFRDY